VPFMTMKSPSRFEASDPSFSMLVGAYARKAKIHQRTSVFILLDIISLLVPLKASLAKSLARQYAAFEERELIMLAQVQNVFQDLLLPTTVIFSEIVEGLKSLRKTNAITSNINFVTSTRSLLKTIVKIKINIPSLFNTKGTSLSDFFASELFLHGKSVCGWEKKIFFLQFPKCLSSTIY